MLTPSQRYESECAGKRGWASKAEAKAAQARSVAHGNPPLRIYRCTWCERWHCGHRMRPRYDQMSPANGAA
jgi:hypothetical protein